MKSVTTSVYLSAAHPRFNLTSEADLHQAAATGLLIEGHFLDVKRLIPSGKPKNVELARDIASFAVDGGTILVGVDELADGTAIPCPQKLDGLAERVEQVASMIPDPPVPVRSVRIPTAGDSHVGYLAIHIPKSSQAPHMVDGRYLARGDKTKRYLTDPEVRRLYAETAANLLDADVLLEAEFNRDPIPSDVRRKGHLFLVAQPQTSRPDLMSDLIDGDRWQERVFAFVREHAYSETVNSALQRADAFDFEPEVASASVVIDARAQGVAISTPTIGRGRAYKPGAYAHPEHAAELELHDNGAIRVFLGRLTDHLPKNVDREPRQQHVLFDVAAIMYTRRFLGIVTGVAERGYLGTWTLAAGATGVLGARSLRIVDDVRSFEDGTPYDEDRYMQSMTSSYEELTTKPGAVADRLIGRLLRTMGTRQTYIQALQDPSADL
jgi:hypothetical protein